MKSVIKATLWIAVLVLNGGCGQLGPLFLPEVPAPEPVEVQTETDDTVSSDEE